MGLFKPAWQRELEKGLKLIKKTDDPVKLKEIAMNHYYHPDMRLAAAQKTGDPAVLAELALKADVGSEYSMAIADEIADKNLAQKVYASAAKGYPGNMAAVEKLSGQAVLVDVAKNALDVKIIHKIVNKLSDPFVFNQVVLQHKSDSIRLEIIEKVTDEETLKSLRNVNLYSNQVWEAATKRLYNISGICLHNFVYGSSYHPHNTGQAVRDGKCTICGFVETQDYGWDDNS